MPQIEIYSKDYCPYCVKAKMLLQGKGVEVVEYDITHDVEKQQEVFQKSGGRRTVPQIFVDGKCLGGYDDIHALDVEGKLDAILGL